MICIYCLFKRITEKTCNRAALDKLFAFPCLPATDEARFSLHSKLRLVHRTITHATLFSFNRTKQRTKKKKKRGNTPTQRFILYNALINTAKAVLGLAMPPH